MELNKLFLKEIHVLFQKLDENKKEFSTSSKATLGELLYSITRGLSSDQLLNLSDKNIIEWVRKAQQYEREN